MIQVVLGSQLECLRPTTALLEFFDLPDPDLYGRSRGELDPIRKEMIAAGESVFPDAIKLLEEAKADFEVMETHARDVEEGVSF